MASLSFFVYKHATIITVLMSNIYKFLKPNSIHFNMESSLTHKYQTRHYEKDFLS